jgi:hypothetical protein
MANRGPTLDPNVFTICDLEQQGAKKLPKMYRGEFHQPAPPSNHATEAQFACKMTDCATEYYNEGSMDMIS